MTVMTASSLYERIKLSDTVFPASHLFVIVTPCLGKHPNARVLTTRKSSQDDVLAVYLIKDERDRFYPQDVGIAIRDCCAGWQGVKVSRRQRGVHDGARWPGEKAKHVTVRLLVTSLRATGETRVPPG